MKIPTSTLKMSVFDVYASCFKETCVCTRVAIYNTRVRLKYEKVCITTHVYLLHTQLLSPEPTHASQKCQKNTYFEIRVVWVVMQLTPSVVTTLSLTLTLH